MRRRALLALLLSCATAAPAPERPPAPAPTARSSVAAVLEHADELALTDAQRQTLQQLDDALAEKQDQLKAEAHKRRESGSESPAPMMGGRGRGGGRGMRGAGMRHDAPEPEALAQALDDNDTQTYLEAEKALTEAQRPRARELASKYREELYNWRATRRAP